MLEMGSLKEATEATTRPGILTLSYGVFALDLELGVVHEATLAGTLDGAELEQLLAYMFVRCERGAVFECVQCIVVRDNPVDMNDMRRHCVALGLNIQAICRTCACPVGTDRFRDHELCGVDVTLCIARSPATAREIGRFAL